MEADSALQGAIRFEEWQEQGKPGAATILLGGDLELFGSYQSLLTADALIIEFPSFMDGRGFSHAKKLREMGFTGDLIAAGEVLPDQWQFLQRCGFSALLDSAATQEALSLQRFSDAYQADAAQPQPLFRRVPRGPNGGERS